MGSFGSLVVGASQREHMSAIDFHLNNPIIKSDTHSTDTHGSSEMSFGMMHFMAIFYAPRLKDLSHRTLYSFESIKKYKDSNYQLLPSKYIDKPFIIDSWDEILRLMASLKSGKTTGLQIFKQLNSYSKQNPLEKAMKEFGRLIQTIFILKYYDDLELRQAIEKQLSHIELMNRFSKATFFGQNRSGEPSGVSSRNKARTRATYSRSKVHSKCSCTLELLIFIQFIRKNKSKTRNGRDY